MTCLLDVTLREAGFVNEYVFSRAQVAAIVDALDRGGVEVIEAGYFRPLRPEPTGAACGRAYLETVAARDRRALVSVMVHLRDVALDAYTALAHAGVSLVRFAASPRDLGDLPVHAEAARSAGLQFTVNAVRATELADGALVRMAEAADRLGARCFYVADSNGSLYPESVAALFDRLRGHVGVPLGFHAHDNLRLAFANALAALAHGAAWVDASLGGAGKNGNLVTELVAGHLSMRCGRAYDILTLARAYRSHVAPTLAPAPHAEFCASVCGLLDLNLDRIGELKHESLRTHVPLEELLVRMYFDHLYQRA